MKFYLNVVDCEKIKNIEISRVFLSYHGSYYGMSSYVSLLDKLEMSSISKGFGVKKDKDYTKITIKGIPQPSIHQENSKTNSFWKNVESKSNKHLDLNELTDAVKPITDPNETSPLTIYYSHF